MLLKEVSAFLNRLAVIDAYISDQPIEDNFDFIVFGDMLMFFIATVLTQKSVTINVLLE
jgi:hypothetical protein